MKVRSDGNVAFVPQTKPKTRSVKRTIVRKKSLPVKEKLLYLGTVIAFVLITNVVLAHQAKLEELNYNIQQVEEQTTQVMAEMTSLEEQAKELLKPERIIEMAKSRGMTYDPDRIRPAQTKETMDASAKNHF